MNSNFNGKMHSSNSFEFGFLADHSRRKQIDSRIQKSGFDSKGLSAIESN